jgi:Fur family ferric uptake transcriptional regulator
MSCEQSTAAALKEAGHRLTPQRLMVLSAIRHAPDHVSASEVLGQVKESYPYIDISTVYRTMAALKDMRLVSETDMGGGESRYEWVEEDRHHHLICRGCDNVTLLDHRYLEGLGNELIDGYGFQADIDHFAIFGLCEKCRQTAPA